MKCHQTEQSNKGCSAGGIVISQRAFTAFLLWASEILQDSEMPKQALINAFIMSAPLADDVQTSLGAGSRCKGTKNNVYMQIKVHFY